MNSIHRVFPLLIVFALVFLSCEKRDNLQLLCAPAVSTDCPFQFYALFENGEKVLRIGGSEPFEFNPVTGIGMNPSQSLAFMNDSFSIRQSMTFRDSNDFSGQATAELYFSEISIPEEMSDQEFLSFVKNASWEVTDGFLFDKPFQVEINFLDWESQTPAVDPMSQFIIDDAHLYQFGGVTYVRFMASFSCRLRQNSTGFSEQLTAGRCVALLRKPADNVQL